MHTHTHTRKNDLRCRVVAEVKCRSVVLSWIILEWLVEIKRFEILFYSFTLPFNCTVMNVFTYACMHFCVCVRFCFHHIIDLSFPWGGFRPLSFSDNITGRSTRPARQEVRSSRLWKSLILKKASRSRGHSLRLHLRTSQPWPPFPASFAEYSFCFVQVVAGGGGGVVRSSYSQRGRSAHGLENTITGSICAQKDGSLSES